MARSPDSPAEWLTLGFIVRPHGVRGELRFVPADPELTPPEPPLAVRVQRKDGGTAHMTLSAVRSTQGALLVRLAEVHDRNDAEQLKGARLEVPRQSLPEPEDSEAYVFELEGAAAVDEAGAPLGTVRSVVENPGHDLLLIDTPRGERLLPLVPAMVLRFDRAARTVVLSVPEGLWDE